MRSMRAVLLGVLGIGILFGTSLGTTLWESKLASTVLRWIDSGSTDERLVLVRVQMGSGMQLAANSYAAASHMTWLSAETFVAAEVGVWAVLERAPSLLRAGSSNWELGLPYVHELQAILVHGTSDGIRQIAQLEMVEAILDGEAAVPAPTLTPSTGAAIAANDLARPSALLSCATVTGDQLAGWISDLGWCFLAKQDAVVSDDLEMPLLLAATPVTVTAPSYDLAGLAFLDRDRQAIEGAGTPLGSALSAAAWASSPNYVLSVAGLAELLEAMNQTGADAVAIAPVLVAGEPRPLLTLWRSAVGAGWASLASPGLGASTTRDALPRSDAPTQVSATLGSYPDKILVQWQAVAGASSYEILRAETPAGAYDPIGVASDNSFADADVQTCVQYSYLARSIADAGLGMESARAMGYVGQVPMPSTRVWTNGDAIPGGIRVEWMPSEGATSYRVTRNHYMTGSQKEVAQQYAVANVTEPVFVDTDVVVGQMYLYRVFSLNGCGRSEQSGQAKGAAFYSPVVTPSPLNPPAWFETTRGNPLDEVMVSWAPVKGADSYIVSRALSYGGPYTEVARVAGTAWEDLDVVLCGDYWYRVQSVDGGSVGDPSPILYGSCGHRPTSPERVRASRGTYSESIRIDWAEVDNTNAYGVSRAPTPDGPFAEIGRSTELYFVDKGLSPGQQFWYKVRASNDCGTSGYSEIVRGSTSSS